jgi:AraC family transcriptional regulator of adaptative response / DNA-3-methyladenine glycosylase II
MHSLTAADLKKIIARRDRRFDGRFYFGVKTTGIYCRPICPTKPHPKNIVLFKSATEAENAGYRPCLRCRPDLAPGHRMSEMSEQIVARALGVMGDMFEEDLTVPKLAHTVGVTDRHLRRLFDEQLGASPIEIMITQRLHFAKHMVQATKGSITEIAFAAGFQSLRRFNEVFKNRYHRTPSQMRKVQTTVVSDAITVKLPIRPPYDWQHVLCYLKRHETFGIERVSENEYQRFITRGDTFGALIVSRDRSENFLNVQCLGIPLKEIRPLLVRLRNLFDTDHNPAYLPSSKRVRTEGVRVVGAFDPFETAISILLSQFVSTAHARTILKRVVQKFGRVIGADESRDIFEFPPPAALVQAAIEELGVPRTKAQAIRDLARGVMNGTIDFKAHGEFSSITAALRAIKGVGPWTAAMIAMRCLGNPDAFPAGDLIVQRAVEKKLVDPDEWRSLRAYLTHYVWREFGESLSKVKRRKVE